jgi:Glycosyltransferase (GlcNAc)
MEMVPFLFQLLPIEVCATSTLFLCRWECQAQDANLILFLTRPCTHSTTNVTDGERCGETLLSLFENAKNPDKVIVGLVEQNSPNDAFCLEEYCKAFGTYE